MMSLLATVAVVRMLAGPAPMPDRASSIEIVVDASIVDGEALSARLGAEVEDLLEVLPGPRPIAPISLLVTGELLSFGVRLDQGEVTHCPCTHAELVTHVLRRVADASDVSARSSADLPGLPPEVPPEVQTITLYEGLGARGRGGLASMVVGGLVAGAGTGLLLGPTITRSDLSSDSTDLRPHAVTAIALGGSAIVTGAILLYLERRDHRRRSAPGA